MTIAIGFRCVDGVVLCADQKITGGSPPFEKKIRPINQQQDCFLVYAGGRGFARDLLDTIQKTCANLEGEGLINEIKTHYREFLTKFYVEAQEPLKTSADMLFTARDGGKVRLFTTDANNVHSVTKYGSYGTGSALADPLLYAYFKRDFSVDRAANLGIYTLNSIKDFADGCGGPTSVIKIRDESPGTAKLMEETEIKEIEQDMFFFQETVKKLFLDFPDTKSWSDQEYASASHLTFMKLRDYREEAIKKAAKASS